MMEVIWTKKNSIGAALAYIVLGIVLVVFPGVSGNIFVWGLSASTMIYGLSKIFLWYKNKKSGYEEKGNMILGLIFIGISIFSIIWPEMILKFMPLTLGVILVIEGLSKLVFTIELIKLKSNIMAPAVISFLIPLVLGIFLIANPLTAAKFVIMLFGLSLLMEGICDTTSYTFQKKEESKII